MTITVFCMGMVLFAPLSCIEKQDVELFEMEGFIVGYNPCTINHQYRLGYIIISNDFSDTIATYSLSPREYRMPAPVGLDPKRPVYTIPEEKFRNFRSSAYFPEFLKSPDSLIIDYPIKVIYRKATENEQVINRCTFEVYLGDFSRQWLNNQVIVTRASRN